MTAVCERFSSLTQTRDDNRLRFRVHSDRLKDLLGIDFEDLRYDATISLGCPLSLKTTNMGNSGSTVLHPSCALRTSSRVTRIIR